MNKERYLEDKRLVEESTIIHSAAYRTFLSIKDTFDEKYSKYSKIKE